MKRWIITLLCLVIVVSAAFSGGDKEKPTEDETSQAEPTGKYGESPMLTKLVKEGKLPPVDERLPLDPAVVGPGSLFSEGWVDFQIGKYGGSFNLTQLQPYGIMMVTGTNILRGVGQSTKDPDPTVVSRYAVSDNNRTFEFTIREGIKWSDGVPVTTEDVRFLFENIYMHEEIYPIFPAIFRNQGKPKGKPADLEIVDDYTFILRFDDPYGWLIADMTSWITDYTKIIQPSHYLKQFHIDYTTLEKIEPLMAEAGIDSWVVYIQRQEMTHWENRQPYALETPFLTPWIPEEITTTRLRFVRNPYYFKVDQAGNQLPYIDYIVSDQVSEVSTLDLAVISGKTDLLCTNAKIQSMPLYQQNAERGDYRILMTGSINNPPLFFLNQDYDYENPDSVWQKLIQDPEKRFANALALAIDSEDANNSLYFGLYGTPEVTTSEYSPDKANKLLDEIGMDKRDADGFRLGIDGEKFEMVITVAPIMPDMVPMAEILKDHFDGIQICFQPKESLTPDRGTLNIGKARNLLGYNPQNPIDTGYPKYIQW